jgi:hypothetical protein
MPLARLRVMRALTLTRSVSMILTMTMMMSEDS